MLLIAEGVRITLLVAFPDKCRRSGPAEIHFYGNAVSRPPTVQPGGCYHQTVTKGLPPKSEWVRADFNGVFGELLCLSHEATCLSQSGLEITLSPGLRLTAFDEDADEHGNRDDLIASGTVEPSPTWLQCRGSRWVLRIDENGVRSESQLA